MKERLDPTGADLVANTPAQFRTWIADGRSLRFALRAPSRRRNLHRSVYAACSFTL